MHDFVVGPTVTRIVHAELGLAVVDAPLTVVIIAVTVDVFGRWVSKILSGWHEAVVAATLFKRTAVVHPTYASVWGA